MWCFKRAQKSVIAVVIGFFLLAQTCWSVSFEIVEKVNAVEETAGSMTAGELASQQTIAESVISTKQALEDITASSGPTYEYDELGRVIKTIYENGDYIITSYVGSTTNKYRDTFFGSGDIWQRTIEYIYVYGRCHKKYQWFSDPNPTISGDVVYLEYRAQEGFFPQDNIHNVAKTVFDNGDYLVTTYWGGMSEKYRDEFFSSSDIWQKTIEYYRRWINGKDVMHYQWIADANPNTPGDVTWRVYEYALNGRITNLGYDNGASEAFEYYGSTTKIYRHHFGNPDGTWQKTIEYYEDGTTMHYQWIADANPNTPGDVIYEEYDTAGRLIRRVLDDGTVIYY